MGRDFKQSELAPQYKMKLKTQTNKLNNRISAIGERIQDHDQNDPQSGAIVGFRNVFFWTPGKKAWIAASTDPDKFLITAETTELAWTEFWTRWKLYITKRFPGMQFLKIEPNN